MRLETRVFDKGETTLILAICESTEESRIIDLLGDDSGNRNVIPISGEILLSDDCLTHYLLLKKIG